MTEFGAQAMTQSKRRFWIVRSSSTLEVGRYHSLEAAQKNAKELLKEQWYVWDDVPEGFVYDELIIEECTEVERISR